MKAKVLDICSKAAKGGISAKEFYEKLSAVAEDTRTDDDLACVIEDALMEIEMEHGGAKNTSGKILKEAAQMILDGIEKM